MTGHSIVGPALMKWVMFEMVAAWCAGRGDGEEAGRRGWWGKWGRWRRWGGSVVGLRGWERGVVERRARGGWSHEVEGDDWHGRALVLGRWVSLLLGEKELAPPLLGEHAEGAQLLHCVPHVIRVEEEREHLQQPVRDEERLGGPQRTLRRRHPRHRRVVRLDQALQREVVACSHHANRQVGRASELVAVERCRLRALEEHT